MINKHIILGCRYNPYTNKTTGEFKDVYQLWVVSALYDSNGVYCGFSWPVDYKNKKAYKSMPIQVSADEVNSWGMSLIDIINCPCEVFYDSYGNIVKVNPVISE